MTNTALAERATDATTAIEQALIGGDLARLTAPQRLNYYRQVCASLGLNPLTKPFAYIVLNGKLVLYALKDCTEQLRNRRNLSLAIIAREAVEDCYVVTARASMPGGRVDESIGAVPLGALKGEARANAMMKAETKAKRRVTLSICGLGMLDEAEAESVPSATRIEAEDMAEDAPALDAAPLDGDALPADAFLVVKVEDGPAGSKGRITFHRDVEGNPSLVTWNRAAVDAATAALQARTPVRVETKRSTAGNVRIETLTPYEPLPTPATTRGDGDDIPF